MYSFILLFLISGGRVFAQVIVPSFHGAYASKESTVAPTVSCGAYTAAGVYKKFLCHNLGADTSLNPHIPVQEINGDYYQWGRITRVATASTTAGAITGWNTVAAANGAWTDASKTATDPCPAGYRVPTRTQWDGVIANNTVSRSGSWVNNGNFTTAIHFGTSTTKTLTLPAAGFRSYTTGALLIRGTKGHYWSSTVYLDICIEFYFLINQVMTLSTFRPYGQSVRCISE